jgi:hypothetical protein
MVNVTELPLQVRFEAAYGEFRAVYLRRLRDAHSGVRPYPSHELVRDVYAAAGNWGLFAESLFAYFRILYGHEEGR